MTHIFVSLSFLAATLTPPPMQPAQPVRAVAAVDLARYAGRWHEVARFPNWFQRACSRNTTADYELRPDSTIRVVNQCTRADGSTLRAEGRARLADARGPTSQLKVRFAPAILSFLPMVWGDYWVLDLTDDYRVALVGDPGRKYLWILSRVPNVDESIYQRMVKTAAAQGFDVSRLERAITDTSATVTPSRTPPPPPSATTGAPHPRPAADATAATP